MNKLESIQKLIHDINRQLESVVLDTIPTLEVPVQIVVERYELCLKDLALSKLKFPLFYWDGRNKDSNYFLALGCLKEVNQIEHLQLHNSSIVVGGVPFVQNQSSEDICWKTFRDQSFYIPEVIIQQKDQSFELTFFSNCTFQLEKQQETTGLKIHSEKLYPDNKKWKEMVESSCKDIEQEKYKKIVLSRYAEYTINGELFSHLQKSLQVRQNSYTLIWATDPKNIFISQSPETLFKLQDDRIYVDSLAGTIPRGKNREEDKKNKQTLQSDPKELEEHHFVTEFLIQQLSHFCSQTDILQKESVTELEHIQHLHTKITGQLNQIDFKRILQTLHPTPAIGGFPQKGIQKLIYKKENFDRGYYSAPIGYIAKEQSEFLVGIRSALIHDNNLKLFAGAGIVLDSDAEHEWEETANKMKTMRDLL